MANEEKEAAYAHSNLCVGIDLGTTNSVLATVSVKPNGDLVSKVIGIDRAVDSYTSRGGDKYQFRKENTLPSCVYYNPEQGYKPVVGDYAKRRYPLRPYLVAKSIKSQMRNEKAQGLAPEVPDTTPAEVSSRILQHLLHGAEGVFRTHIHDAVITVPANFDSVMCRATQDAAALAGITTEEADGSERPVLLSEPNAVLYDFINQVTTGEISGEIIDLSRPRNVMVFDLGGGTLDITLHSVQRRSDLPDVLKVQDIATNRYTLLGGDDFDEAIAQAMFQRYLAEFRTRPEIVDKIRRAEKDVMPTLRVFAEDIKIELSNRHSDAGWADAGGFASGWDDSDAEEDDDTYPTGGNIAVTGIAYDDAFRTEELEEILRPFLGEKLSFQDYRHLDDIHDTRNIIFPILDVLKKAAEKLGAEDVKIDAVVMNGGMSRFYMVRDRLKAFFGFDPVIALDPDLAVARGAAIYHYYLHQHDAIRDDMRMLGSASQAMRPVVSSRAGAASVAEGDGPSSGAGEASISAGPPVPQTPRRGIEWGHAILPDALYLGLRGGGREEVVPTGAELPYHSPHMTGFRLAATADRISIPFYVRNLDGTYRRIANGVLRFHQAYSDGAYVAFEILMNSSKLIRMNAWTCRQPNGADVIENGSAQLVITDHEESRTKNRILPKVGAEVDLENTFYDIERNCIAFEQHRKGVKGQKQQMELAKKIRSLLSLVQNAGNAAEAGMPLIRRLRSTRSEEFKHRAFVLARRLEPVLSDDQKRIIVKECQSAIDTLTHGIDFYGTSVTAGLRIEAIQTIGVLGTVADADALAPIHAYARYRRACLYAHGRTRTQVHWVYKEFSKDCKLTKRKTSSGLQFSARAIGLIFFETDEAVVDGVKRNNVIRELVNAIEKCVPTKDALVICLLACGWLCDQRSGKNPVPASLLKSVTEMLEKVTYDYPEYFLTGRPLAAMIAKKLIQGKALDQEEAKFLLEKIEV